MLASIPYRLHRALAPVCSTDSARPALGHILVEGNRVVATNGHILASVPTLDATGGGMIPAVIPKAPATARVMDERGRVTRAGDTVTVSSGDATATAPVRECGEYPDTSIVEERAAAAPVGHVVSLDASLLATLAKALNGAAGLGGALVTLVLPESPGDPIRVLPCAGKDVVPPERGLLMPVNEPAWAGSFRPAKDAD